MVETGLALLAEAASCGAAICCLPEYFNVFGVDTEQMAEIVPNWRGILDRVRDVCEQSKTMVILPMLVDDDSRFLSRAYLIGERGDVVGHYDKVHPTAGEREKLGMEPGNEIKAFDTEHGRIGIAICYDVYFAELFSSLAAKKPDIIFLPSLQRSEHEIASEVLLRARAMDTAAYVVRSSFGREPGLAWQPGMMFGQSCVVHPDGTMLASAGHYEGLALARVEVPFCWKRQRCSGYPAMPVRDFLTEDRRPEVYR